MKTQKTICLVILLAVLLAVMVNPGAAQEGAPASTNAAVSSRISYQGVLKEGGVPVNGTRDITFRLYSNSTCTTQVGADIVKTGVSVVNGLFTVALDVGAYTFSGDGVWMSAVVGGTAIGCQEILPVPYALGLRPGTQIAGASSNFLMPVLAAISNSGEYGTGITAQTSGDKGYAGYFWNLSGGAAIYANGKIQSSTKSYLWLSGNGLVKYQHDDSTIIDANGFGGATVYRGATAGTKYVVMPVVITGPLYGQDVTVSGLDIYWQGDTSFGAIVNIRLRRQTSACNTCYTDIIFDTGPGGAGYSCEDGVDADGCTIHLDLTTNNVLTADSGILYLVVGLAWGGDSEWIRFGGVRLTMEHK